jgi:hypothetical protein
MSAEPHAALPHPVERARQFLREISEALERHPVACRTSRLQVHERRSGTTSVLRLSGTVDGVPVDLRVHVYDDEPLRPRLEYSRTLDLMRMSQVMGLGASAFTAAHDEACRRHFPQSDSWQQTLKLAAQESRVLAALARNGLH